MLLVFTPERGGALCGGSAVIMNSPTNDAGYVVAIDGTLLPLWWKLMRGGAVANASATYFLDNS